MDEPIMEYCQSNSILKRLICKGNCVMFNYKDSVLVVFVLTLLIGFTLFFSCGTGWYLWKYESPAFLIIVWILVSLTLLNYVMCAMRDPGIVVVCDTNIPDEEKAEVSETNIPKVEANEALDQSQERINVQDIQSQIKSKKDEVKFYKYRFCTTCKIYRPPKSSHCSPCGHCIKDFDHHCFFVGNCVGARNHKNFVYFLLFGALTSLMVFAFSIYAMIRIGKYFEHNSTFSAALGLLCGAYACMCCPFPGTVRIIFFSIIGTIGVVYSIIYAVNYDSDAGIALLQIFSIFPLFIWTLTFSCGNCGNILEGKTLKERTALKSHKMFNSNESVPNQINQGISNIWYFISHKIPESEIKLLK